MRLAVKDESPRSLDSLDILLSHPTTVSTPLGESIVRTVYQNRQKEQGPGDVFPGTPPQRLRNVFSEHYSTRKTRIGVANCVLAPWIVRSGAIAPLSRSMSS